MFQELNNWGRWGADDELGTMNLVTPEKTREAAALVRRGLTVSLAHNPMPDEAVDNPDAAFNHTMAESLRSDTYEFRYRRLRGQPHRLALPLRVERPDVQRHPAVGELAGGGLRQARHPEPQAGDRHPRHPARLRAPEGRAVPGAADADLCRGHRGLGRDGGRHGVAGRRHLRADRALGAPRRAGTVAGLGQQRRAARVGAAVDQGAGRRHRRQRRGHRRDAVAGRGGHPARAHDAHRRLRHAHLRQHGSGGAGRDGGAGEPLGVHAHRRADPGRGRHGGRRSTRSRSSERRRPWLARPATARGAPARPDRTQTSAARFPTHVNRESSAERPRAARLVLHHWKSEGLASRQA